MTKNEVFEKYGPYFNHHKKFFECDHREMVDHISCAECPWHHHSFGTRGGQGDCDSVAFKDYTRHLKLKELLK